MYSSCLGVYAYIERVSVILHVMVFLIYAHIVMHNSWSVYVTDHDI